MRVLFVCTSNVGRSQVARGLFSLISTHESDSAGTKASEAIVRESPPSRKMKDAPIQIPVNYLKEQGLDISEVERKQLTSSMLRAADMVIVLAERATWPSYLLSCDKVTCWEIPDTLHMRHEDTYRAYDQIKERVERLVQEIG